MVNDFSSLFTIRVSSLAPKRTYEASRRLVAIFARRITIFGTSATFVKRLLLVSVCRYTVWSPQARTCVYDSPGIMQLDLSAFHDINRSCLLSGKCQGDCHRFEATYRCRSLRNNWPFCRGKVRLSCGYDILESIGWLYIWYNGTRYVKVATAVKNK